MKNSRFQFEYRASASKLHKTVGDLLRNSIFKGYKIFQEYPVNKINPKFHSGREKFDWYIEDIKLVVECHGRQHELPIDFSGDLSPAEVELEFKRQKIRDAMKMDAALNVGCTYIIIWYDEEINEKLLLDKILAAQPSLEDKVTCELPDPLDELIEPVKLPDIESKHRERLTNKEKASLRRKQIREQYKRSAEYKEKKRKAKELRKIAYEKVKAKQKKFKKGKK